MPRSAYELEGEVRTLDPDPRRGSSFRSSPEVDSRQEITLRDLTVIYRRRQKIIYGVVGAFALLAAIYCIVATRRYDSTGIIQVQSKSQDGLGLDTMASGGSETSPDALAVNMDIQTQVNILQSDSLGIKTIEQLHMEGTKDFESHWNPIGWFFGLFSPAGTPDPANASLENSPQRRRRALLVFENHLKVKATPGTRLIDITYSSPDPKLAAAVVNKLTELLIDYSFQTRFDATNQAASWLNSQIGDLRQQSEQLQKQVSDLESKSGIYTIGTVGADGRTQNYSDVLDKLQSATAAVSQAEQNRILRGAILHAAQSGDAEMLSGLAGNTSNGAAMNGSLTVIQNLRGQEATARAALQQAEAKYGPAYPRLQELRGNVAGLDHSIQQEIERLKGRAQSDYDDAVRTEDENRAQYNQLKAQADTLNNKSIDVAIVRQEADQSRSLYDELLKKFKEAGVLEGLKGSTITVVDPGRVPGKPDKPNIPLYMAIAIFGGFFLGCCGALLIESMDEKINTVSEVERISGDHLLGATPIFLSLGSSNGSSAGYDGVPQLASISDPQSPFIEAARSIRTEIFLMGGSQKASQVILVTSSVPGEGKTVLSANLAVLLAQSGKKVLLIDADLRLGALQTTLNLPAGTGLSELLSGAVEKPQIYPVPGVPKLDALQVGAAPDNPSELLGSGVLAAWLATWREKYDYIVLDSAPLLPVTDSLTLAPLSDITLLVARPGLTEKSQLIRSYQLLTRRSNGFVAAIVNGLQPGEEGYSSYFGYRKPENSYGAIVKARK
jgi:capsular exopolysaccharide synthesis family protein